MIQRSSAASADEIRSATNNPRTFSSYSRTGLQTCSCNTVVLFQHSTQFAQLLLDGRALLPQLGQAREMRELLQVLLHRPRRCPPHPLSLAHYLPRQAPAPPSTPPPRLDSS